MHERKENSSANRVTLVTLAGKFPSSAAHPINILMALGSLNKYQRLLNASAFVDQNFTLMAVSETGNITTLYREIFDSKIIWHMRTASAKSFANEKYMSLGSGSRYNRCLVDAAFKEGKITLLDVFLYGSHLDQSSSTDYSVYGFEENHLYATVRPDAETVMASYNKVFDLFKFKGLKESYFSFSNTNQDSELDET